MLQDSESNTQILVSLVIGLVCMLFSFSLLTNLFNIELQSASAAISTVQNTNNNARTNEQSTSSNNTSAINYLIYQDPISGIKLQYPSNWIKIERGNYVEFLPSSSSSLPLQSSLSSTTKSPLSPPSKTSNQPPTTRLTAFEIKIDGNLPFDVANSLDKYTRLKVIPQKQFGEFKLIESNATTIGGNNNNYPAYKVVYTNTFHKTGVVLKTMEITTIKDNIGYDIKYFTDPSTDYPKHLDVVQKMIDSLQFIGLSGR
jgi:hypothetical protein